MTTLQIYKPFDRRNPYFIEGPALVSFSGGRTSGYMLRMILDANGGALPRDVHVVFANTGKEMPETLDFIQECASRWGVRIVWLEHRFDEDGKSTFEIVSHNSASRNGEPFNVVLGDKGFLPNPLARFCTAELKVKTMQRYMRSLYPDASKRDGWANVVGLRYDEPHRVARLHNDNDFRMGCDEHITPLAEARVTKFDVKEFWDAQDFDLRLPNVDGVTPLGNCDLCFLKGVHTIFNIVRERPELAQWWIDAEAESAKTADPLGAVFRKDRPAYANILRMTQTQGDLMDGLPDDAALPCMCTD